MNARSTLIVIALLFAAPILGEYHKCTDADGNVTYSQTACPAARSADRTRMRPSEPNPGARGRSAACTTVHQAALRIAQTMQDGVKRADAIALQGGVEGIDDRGLELINHVYRYQDMPAVSAHEAAVYTESHCLAGGFSFSDGNRPATRASSRGSGFIINRRGTVMTNRHVVKDCDRILVEFGNRAYEATLLHARADTDLAIVQAARLKGQPAMFSANTEATPGETVVAVGFPLRHTSADQIDIGVGHVNADAGVRDDASTMQISVPIQPGCSGGPVIDRFGLIKGVTVALPGDDATKVPTDAIQQPVGLAIKGRIARDFLLQTGTPHFVGNSFDSLPPEVIAEDARGYTVLVECLR